MKEKKRRHSGAERSSKKHKSSSGSASSSSSSAESLIYRYITKVVDSLRSTLPASVSSSSSSSTAPALLKSVTKKAASKVIEDWSSKPRGDLPMHQWLNDKRKSKIKELVQKYMNM